MILIADSGSTKCDWMILSEGAEPVEFKTMGINPFFHSEVIIEAELRKSEEVLKNKEKITEVYFYGAGSSTDHYKSITKRGLKKVFTKADVVVDHDLNGAALATWQGEPAITCILGTGSNSGFFDGKNLTEVYPALGYILGDEGSGSYFGKKLFRDFLYKRLPHEMNEDLRNNYGMNKEVIFESVYVKPGTNVYLASFMKFIGNYQQTEYVQSLVKEGFEDFIDTHVLCFKQYDKVKTHFIGSVAHYFKKELRQVCIDRNVHMGNVIRKPIFGLRMYHENGNLIK